MPAFHWDGHLILLCSQGDPWPDKHEACIQHATPMKGKHHILKEQEFTPSPRMHLGPMLIFSVSFQFSRYVPDKHEAYILHATPMKGKHHILKEQEFTPSPRMHLGPMLIFSVSFQFSHYENATQKKSYLSMGIVFRLL